MNEHLMLPIVGMLPRISSRGKLEDAHAEILRTVFFADDNAGCDSFYFVTFVASCLNISISYNLHYVLLDFAFRLLRTTGALSSWGYSRRVADEFR